MSYFDTAQGRYEIAVLHLEQAMDEFLEATKEAFKEDHDDRCFFTWSALYDFCELVEKEMGAQVELKVKFKDEYEEEEDEAD